MFDHFALGTQARSGSDGSREELPLSPRQRPRELLRPTEVLLSPSESSPAVLEIPLPPPQPIDNLTHELSKQTLIPELPPRGARTTSAGALSSTITDLSMADLEVDDDCDMSLTTHDIREHQPVADWKRARRQRYSRYVNNPANTRAIEARVKGMISEELQCNIHPSAAMSSLPAAVPVYPHLPNIAADGYPEIDPALTQPGVDEGFCDQDEEFAFMKTALAADRERLMSKSGGMRNYGSLRFRGSAETALRCQNVVRQRPRMRRRKGPGPTNDPRPT
ncbi:hypothetical protein CORC01_09353 [Colletotrichum orchidophilum]|uniref:Uncharacterized protein n=1 Tax=Colletotrichum orchidophilum TaxID=1209926 RepID=A0A1G4B207_9PEZI|nr:uncharacterized protein CORC01_09353 [Colletotrichum orchidophilum]OHE95342.1 hypothetical protein CORC01_09353 [Colletotrichum orchidophilum]